MSVNYPITSGYKAIELFRDKAHTGIDFAMTEGTPLRSIQNGVVEKIVNFGDSNIGKGIFVRWEDGKTAIYGHLSDITVKVGEKVKIGELLGHSGNTGNVTGAGGGYHLHFGLKENGMFIDPSAYTSIIQRMNDNSFLSSLQDTSYTIQQLLQDQANVYEELFRNLKLHFIQSIDYPMFMQYIEHFFQFFT